jgi:hypothetical protein
MAQVAHPLEYAVILLYLCSFYDIIPVLPYRLALYSPWIRSVSLRSPHALSHISQACAHWTNNTQLSALYHQAIGQYIAHHWYPTIR